MDIFAFAPSIVMMYVPHLHSKEEYDYTALTRA